MEMPTLAIRSTAPTLAQEPVTLAEAKRQCNIPEELDNHDTALAGIIQAARDQFERDTGIVCYTGTYTWKFTDWPACEYIEIRNVRPVTSITSIAYIDGSGNSTTWSASEYTLETSGVQPLVRLAYSSTWPNVRGDINGITVTMVAGYAATALPPSVRLAVLTLVKGMWCEYVQEVDNAGKYQEAYERQLYRLTRRTYP